MFTGTLTLSTAPTVEPLTVEDLRDHCRETSTELDAQIEAYGKSAREAIEEWSGRQFMLATYTLKLDDWPSPSDATILLPRPPLLSVSSISYVDTDGNSQTLATSVYTVDTNSAPGRVFLAFDQVWPDLRDQRHAVTVTYTAGYSSSSTAATARAAVPERIKQSIRIGTKLFYDLGYVDLDELLKVIQHLLWSFRVLEFA